MMDHSDVKVKLLRLYLERYLGVLNTLPYIDNIHIFDLFCGEGVYENGGKGSPIIMLEVIKNIHLRNKNKGGKFPQVHCIFNDIEVWKTNKVQLEIQSSKLHDPEIGKLGFTNKDYQVLLPQVIQRINRLTKDKAFVFIDPYGYKEIRISDIKALLKSKNSEVLLFLPTQFMFRFEEKGTPESLKDFIEEIVPIDKWPKSDTGVEFIENLKEGFKSALGIEYFVDSFIITRDKNQFFCLFFFTSHIYGYDRMLDAKWEIDEEEGRGWVYAANADLFCDMDKSANTYLFEKSLKHYLSSFRTNEEIYNFTLHNGHRPAHANQILTNLQKEGRIDSINPDGSPARKGSFYINYRDCKNNPNKIRVKLIR